MIVKIGCHTMAIKLSKRVMVWNFSEAQPYQQGAGLGRFFKAYFRMAVPIFKSVGKLVGKHALAANSNVMAGG